MHSDTLVTPECTALKTVEAFYPSFVAVSAFDSSRTALPYGQHIKEAVDAKVGGQIFKISSES